MSRPEHLMNLPDLGEYSFRFEFMLPKIQLILVSEAYGAFIPYLKFDILCKYLTMQSFSLLDMDIQTRLILYAIYYNNKLGVWEPLLEKFDVAIKYIFAGSKVDLKINPGSKTNNSIKLNITPEFIKLLSNVYYFINLGEKPKPQVLGKESILIN